MPAKPKHLSDKICEFCKSPFNRRRFGKRLEDATRFLSRRFCSEKCSGAAHTKENPTDRTTFYARAQKFKKSSCEKCGIAENLDAHHKDRNLANNTAENIQTLCHPCHMRLHWQEDKNFGGVRLSLE